MQDTISIIILLVLIFIILYLSYSCPYNKENDFTEDYKLYALDNMLDIMNQSKKDAKDKINKMGINNNNNIKEKFKALTQEEADAIIQNINSVNYWIRNNYMGTNGIKVIIQSMIKNANNTKDANKETLLKLLTNIYVIEYIDSINRQNAESYKVFLKYSNPKNNKYYSQYTS
jgi:hypothetical protein